MTAADALNAEFGIAGQLRFRQDASGLIVAGIDNAHATASLCLQGAHLMAWQPKSQTEPVIWLSRDARLAAGKAIRGGVPICWPWFGPHAGDKSLPAHGIMRTLPWTVVATRCDPDGATRLSLCPVANAQMVVMLDAAWRCELTVIVGSSLRMELITGNMASSDSTHATGLVIEEALHTYLRIGDIAAVRLRGLEGGCYVDQVDGSARKLQVGEIRFSGETDRIYTGTCAECVIEDDQLGRRIHIAKAGSDSTVVWTPWSEKATRLGDLGQSEGWREMLCVETANVLGDAVTIPADGEHTLMAEIHVEAM